MVKRLIFAFHLQKLSHAGEFKPHAAFLPYSRQHWQGEKLVGDEKRHGANVKESIIVMDQVSKAFISKFSELMNGGGNQTRPPKWEKII